MSVEPLNWGRGSTQRSVLPSSVAVVNNDGQRWSVAARTAEVQAIQHALREPGSVGVALTGARGMGKSSLARMAVAGLGPDVHTVQFRSNLAGSRTPYGCLSFLLARLPAAAMASPTAILQGITSLIRQDSAGRDCVITLDSAADIDDMSAGVLLNILLTGTARIVAIAPETGALPADFHWLLGERRLTEVRLENLTEQQTRQVLVSMLGHRVASSLVRTYHSMVGGNPQLLRALVAEQLQCGNLVLSDAVWTLQDKVVLSGATSLEDIVRSRWARERPECREVIEMLACSRRVPLVKLTDLFGADVIADMEDAGELTVGTSDARWVTLRAQYLGEVVRSWLSIARQRELRGRLLDGREPVISAMSAEDLLDFAAWTRECEADLEPRLAVAAAGAAVQLFDPRFALSCLEDLQPSDPEWITGQRYKAEAYLLLDLPDRAWAALETISSKQLQALPPVEQALLTGTRCRVMAWLPEHAGRVPEVLQETRLRLGINDDGTCGVPWPSPLAVAAHRLSLSGFEYKAFTGDFASMVPDLERAADPQVTTDPWFRMQASIILMTALSITGREVDALELMRATGGHLTDVGHAPGLRESYALHRFHVLLLAGQWRRCLEVASPGSDRAVFVLPQHAALPELLTGISYVYAGRGAEALDPLLSAIAQLEPRPGNHMLREACAAIALAYAQQGNAVESRSYLDRLEELSGPCPFTARCVIEFCSLLAARWLGDPSAAEKLEASAREDMAKGRYTRAGISLLAATVNGTDRQFALMEEASHHRQGPLAEVSRLVAVGSRTGDAKVLLEAAEHAAGLELDAVEARCAALALDFARQSGDTMSARTAQGRLDRVSGHLAALPIVPRNGNPLLTGRERQVARLALGGASNREIAEEMGVSVRTVEGHLYQVFTKLGVTSRGDLPGLI
ncbi:LuxR C-terminal-related transcriptional regulator [Pseudarthrobacter sp. J64]|uniref:helix-turn-helix transcriptional regulator n=1 Tax=Pseudarthrobacter sp. J64 TaxID=3116485 RepID=UPI002E811D27|nr:LuxR C-terminal-related transcriptional regulator [Pseudarthrobacter sp. J64]MEE2569306.1 LuxR C-terminal-related transcriptional regulator [Pseudarthrobacter sp. J64]